MHLVYRATNLETCFPQERIGPSVVAIGNFDGVHRGHQYLLNHLGAIAQAKNLTAVVLTFEPHPKSVLDPASGVIRLTNFRDKITLLKQTPAQGIVVQRFDQTFGQQTGQNFIEALLIGQLRARHLVIGDDFHFGRHRTENAASLQIASKAFDIETDILPAALWNEEKISSTRIRCLLERGKINTATELLGHPYFISGRIQAGRQIGRTIGFPTLNMNPGVDALPVNGVFIAYATVDQKTYPAIANVGKRPTVETSGRLSIEAHLLAEFAEPIEDPHLKVTFLKKIRDEKRFETLTALQSAIASDKQTALSYFEFNGNLHEGS